jgi:hypothetical protein
LVDGDGPAAALVVNQASGVRTGPSAGAGVARRRCDHSRSACAVLSDAGRRRAADRHRDGAGWAQFRGARRCRARPLPRRRDGTVDGYVDCVSDAHGVWDYLGGALVCAEAGAIVTDALDRDLVVLEHAARRTPVAAATTDLHSGARRRAPRT